MWFKKKKIESKGVIDLLVEYIEESKANNISLEETLKRLKEKGYHENFINSALDIYEKRINDKISNIKKEVLSGMKNKKEEYNEDEDFEEDEDSDDLDLEESEEEEKPKKKVEVRKEIKKEEVKDLTSEQVKAVLENHEVRIRELESTLFRLRNL